MSLPNSRKRAAPGASPTPQITQAYPAAPQMSNADYRWSQGTDNMVFPDHTSTSYNMNTYSGNNVPQPQSFSNQQSPSTQLARRPVNQHLMQTAPRYDNPDAWAQYGDDQMVEMPGANGPMEESDNIELLEERAAVAKRDSQSKRKQIPPFVQKLSSFLDESKNTELIRWSDRGDSFVVLDEDEFAKTLIPELFKHNNYASFVRQLNMYGFHKRVGLSDNSMKASERKNKSPSEYYNPYFKRGHPNLLWLINKPKGGSKGNAKPKNGTKGKSEDPQERDSDEDGQDIEEVIGNVGNYPPAITQGTQSSSLERQNVSVIQNQLMEIQKQQGAITNAIARLRKDHNQLYQQSVAFQTLHDRHENSINSILTFLATVYNRSLDGQGPQNIAQMFANGIPQEQQSGSVVDVTGQQDPHPGNRSPHRRQQRLLMAPPGQGENSRIATATPSASTTPQPPNQNYQMPSASIEELFDSPQDTTNDPQASNTASPGAQNIMNIIQNTNAHHRATSSSHAIQFPDMLSHYETTHGTTLTPEQRNAMLSNMNMLNQNQSGNSPINTNNALASPTPPQPPSIESLNMTQQEIDHLYKLQQEQDQRTSSIAKEVEPLSPSGSIPGLTDANANGYFNPNDFGNPGDGGLDLDQYLDDGAFYGGGNASPGGNIDFSTPAGYGGEDFDLSGIGVTGFDDLGLGGVGVGNVNGNMNGSGGGNGNANANGNAKMNGLANTGRNTAENSTAKIEKEQTPDPENGSRKRRRNN